MLGAYLSLEGILRQLEEEDRDDDMCVRVLEVMDRVWEQLDETDHIWLQMRGEN